MATNRSLWSEAWLDIAVLLFAVISVVGVVYIIPVSRTMGELARHDVERTPANGVTVWGVEYERTYRRYLAVESLLGVLVLVAIFVMAYKPLA